MSDFQTGYRYCSTDIEVQEGTVDCSKAVVTTLRYRFFSGIVGRYACADKRNWLCRVDTIEN